MNKFLIYLISCMILGSCSRPAYLTSPSDFKNHVNGLHVECEIKNNKNIIGEIIEVDDEEITLLVDAGYLKIPINKIEKAEIIVAGTSDSPDDKFSGWTALLSLTSLGHGFFGIISLPLNLSVGGGIAADAKKGSYRVKYPSDISWKEMSKFARFPQGAPPNFYDSKN